MFYFVILINWRNKFSNYSTFTLKIYWTFYSFYWPFWSILLCKINHFTEHTLLANLFLEYWSFYPKYLAFNIVSFLNNQIYRHLKCAVTPHHDGSALGSRTPILPTILWTIGVDSSTMILKPRSLPLSSKNLLRKKCCENCKLICSD